MSSSLKFFILIVFICIHCYEARTARNEQSTATKATTETIKSTTVARPAITSSSTLSPIPASATTPLTIGTTTAVATTSSNKTRIQTFSSSGSALVNNLFTALTESVSNLVHQLTKRLNLSSKTTEPVTSLWNSLRRNDLVRSPLTLSVAGITVAGFVSLIALYMYPSLQDVSFSLLKDRNEIKRIGEFGRSIEQIAETVNAAVDSYSRTEPDTCVKIALCTLGKAKEVSRKSRAIDAVNTVLTFPGLDQYLISNKEWLESHAYGRQGNDCDIINYKQQCPFNYATWKVLLSSLSSVI